MNTADYERDYAKRVIESMSHMSDDDLRYWVDRYEAKRDEPLYSIRVPTADQDRTLSELVMYRTELERREAIKIVSVEPRADGLYTVERSDGSSATSIWHRDFIPFLDVLQAAE